MEKRFFDANPEKGITRTWHYNEDTDEATIQTTQDLTQSLKPTSATLPPSTTKQIGRVSGIMLPASLSPSTFS
jgi:hypothetical protein